LLHVRTREGLYLVPDDESDALLIRAHPSPSNSSAIPELECVGGTKEKRESEYK
jgi:hypothetical protein